jgi:hypothetical protein
MISNSRILCINFFHQMLPTMKKQRYMSYADSLFLVVSVTFDQHCICVIAVCFNIHIKLFFGNFTFLYVHYYLDFHYIRITFSDFKKIYFFLSHQSTRHWHCFQKWF